MRAAVTQLSRLAEAPDNQRAPRELSFVYAEVANVPPSDLQWDQIILGRINRRWRDLLSPARLFLWDWHQQTSAGTIDGHPLLFEMNVLFEQYIAKIASRVLAGTGSRAMAQGGHRDCLYEGDTGRCRIRPGVLDRFRCASEQRGSSAWKRLGMEHSYKEKT